MLMPRFMEVLLETTGRERELFIDAAIACDDGKALREFVRQCGGTRHYILFGHEPRCELFEYLTRKEYGGDTCFTRISDEKEIGDITVRGIIATAKLYLEGQM